MKEETSPVTNELKLRFQANRPEGKHEIANHLAKDLHVKTIGGTKTNELLVYKDGIYVPGEQQVKTAIQDILGSLYSKNVRSEVIEQIQNQTICSREDFEDDKFLHTIPVENGLLDLEKKRKVPHDPVNLYRTKINIKFDKEADCPVFKEFLKGVAYEEDIPIIEEFLGFGLYREYFIKKCLIISGPRNTGKSTFLNLVKEFYGEEQTCSVGLDKISSRFGSVPLYNSLMNISDELNYKDISSTEKIKKVIGKSLVDGEYKGGDSFKFYNYAKMLFACNKIPKVKDVSDDAFWDRFIIVKFEKPVKKIDYKLLDKMLEERSGILNVALEGLGRLLRNGKFSYDKTPEEIRLDMQADDSRAGFVNSCIEKSEYVSPIAKDVVYAAYVQYAQDNNLPVDTKNKLTEYLQSTLPYIKSSRSGNEYTWVGIKLVGVEEEVPLENIPL